MTGRSLFRAPLLFAEIQHRRMTVLHRDVCHDWALERSENGRLTDGCKAMIRTRLEDLISRPRWWVRPKAWCAISGRGVSLRRLKVPVVPRSEFEQLLSLQIESEFPLPPEAMAWGYVRLGKESGDQGVAEEVLVAAVRKEVLEDYAAAFRAHGIQACFTVAGLARTFLRPADGATGDHLHLGEDQCEWLQVDALGPMALRVLPAPAGEGRLAVVGTSLRTDAGSGRSGGVRRLLLTGCRDGDAATARELCELAGGGIECFNLDADVNGAPPAAIRGLQRASQAGNTGDLLTLETGGVEEPSVLAKPARWRWAAVAAFLGVALLLLPMVEALVFGPPLARRLTVLRHDEERLAVIDREYEFLKYLRQNQPPYLDALQVLAKTIPSGSRLSGLSMSRRGELSFRGVLPNSQQVVEFRSRLVDSGFFSTVVIAEQAPEANPEGVRVRVDAQWKPAEARASLSILSDAPDPQAKAGSR